MSAARNTITRTIASAALVAAVAAAHATATPQSDPPKKKPPASWKLPPSKSAPADAPASDSPATPSTESKSDAEAKAAVAMAQSLRIEAARSGAVGAWCDSVQLYYTQSTELFAPVIFSGASSPTLITLSETSIGLFVQQFPSDNPALFGSIARATSQDGGYHWSELEYCTFEGLPETMDGPENPCVCSAGANRLRMFFVARDRAVAAAPRNLMSALSTDHGRSWRVEADKKVPLDGRLASGAEVLDISAANIGSTTHLFLALSAENDALIHAAAIADGAAVMRPKFAASAGGSWRGAATSEKGELVFTGIGAKEAEFVRARSKSGREWKDELIEASKRPPAEEAIDVSWLLNAAGDRNLYAVVTRDENQLAKTPLATSPTTTPAEPAPGNPDAPVATSEDGAVEEAAPKARKSSDPVAAPTALKVQPLGGKKSNPVGAEKGPTAPGLGGP